MQSAGEYPFFGITERKQVAENASYGGYGEVHPTAHRGNNSISVRKAALKLLGSELSPDQ